MLSNKIAAIAEGIYRTGDTPEVGTMITWESATNPKSDNWLRHEDEITAEEIRQAEAEANLWWAGDFSQCKARECKPVTGPTGRLA